MVGDVRFDPASRLIAFDNAYDIATFRVDQVKIERLSAYVGGKLILRGSQASWPPELRSIAAFSSSDFSPDRSAR